MQLSQMDTQDPLWLPPDRPQVEMESALSWIQMEHLKKFQQPVAVVWRSDITEIHYFICPNRVPRYEWWVPAHWLDPEFEMDLDPNAESYSTWVDRLFQGEQLEIRYQKLREKAQIDRLTGENHSLSLNDGLAAANFISGEIFKQEQALETNGTITYRWAQQSPIFERMRSAKELNLSQNPMIRALQEMHLYQYGEPLGVLIQAHKPVGITPVYIPNRFPRYEWRIGWQQAAQMLWSPDFLESCLAEMRVKLEKFMQETSQNMNDSGSQILYRRKYVIPDF